ncbi:MAG: hypothetical protein LQ343_001836 [Gyalolechia ehrenbergii]|nr:MAG: hypothetical protein LQ343_001836 [Gyalolechia ehrenbergii]
MMRRDLSSAPGIDTIAQNFKAFLSDSIPSEPIGNTAVWEEAIANDAKASKGPANQLFSQSIAHVQKYEIASDISNATTLSQSSSAARVLQFLQLYPTRFQQAQAANPAEVIVKISSTPQQTIRSFGASGAWWPNFLKDFPPDQQKNLSTLLFSEDWLHLSGFRYNLGASGNDDSQAVSTPGRGVESFMLSDGSYDWLRDRAGYYYLRAAEDAGVSSITAFVNAIPAALTTDKKPCGTQLDPQVIPKFVAYITEVLSHFSQNGIHIDYISPMNEPDNSFDTCGQEGMSVSHSDRAGVFQQLRSALQESTFPGVKDIKIMGDETSQIASQALLEYDAWLPSVTQAKSIDAIAVHMYDWPDDATLLNYRQLVLDRSKPGPPHPIKMTEISSFTTASRFWATWGKTGGKTMGPEYDPSINSALDMARFIWQWLALVNAESWDWWTAVSNMMPCSPSTTPGCATTYSNSSGTAYNDGLLYIDPKYAETKDYNFYFTKRFWVFKHFTNFLRPGAVRFDITNEILPYGTVAVAAQNTDSVYSTIFINRNATEQGIRMELPGKGGKITASVQTTATRDFEDVPLPVVAADGTVKITLPAKSVLSLQYTVNGPVSSRRGAVGSRMITGNTKRKDKLPRKGEDEDDTS